MTTIRSKLVLILGVLAAMFAFSAAPAFAGSAWWGVSSGLRPSTLPLGPAGSATKPAGEIVVVAQNRGDGSANGAAAPITVTDTVPKGLKVVGVLGYSGVGGGNHTVALACREGSVSVAVSCVSKLALPPFQALELVIFVDVRSSAKTGEENTVDIAGGGVNPASVSRPIEVGGGIPQFGFEDYELLPENEGGGLVTQAGSHPFQLTTVLTLNQTLGEDFPGSELVEPLPVRMAKDTVLQWPAGLVGNPTPLPQCTEEEFSTLEADSDRDLCLPETAVGVAAVELHGPASVHGVGSPEVTTGDVPLFNLTPRAGEPARFGFVTGGNPTFIDTSIRTGGDYGVTVSSSDITQLVGFMGIRITVWGVPSAAAHNAQRGWECLEEVTTACGLPPGSHPSFLVMPTACERPFTSSVSGDSWPMPGPLGEVIPSMASESLSYTLPESLDGCGRLPFAPQISVVPDVPDGSSPTGLSVEVHIPQQESLDAEGLAQSSLRNTTVVLPEGVVVNAGGADGLEACSQAQIGYQGKQAGEPDENLFTAQLPEPLQPGVNFCPDASKIGTVEIETPLLPHTLKGAVYLASQGENPFGSLIAMYLVARDPVSGVLVKLPGEIALDPGTGRIVTTFKDTPQVPFENLRLHFFGGDRAPLSTPSRCGTYTTTASFAPWSGEPPASTSSTFDITSGPNGSPCENPLPFAPSLTAGTTSIQAGGFSPFTLTMSREDGQQNLQAVSLRMPPGLSGLLASVKLCAEAQADAGTCGPESEIGETTVSVGLGGNPFTVTGGRVYITGPYEGAPFGLSIVNPAVAGPFNLGQVVVRAKIEVDPHTADLTITTDNSGAYKIPSILDGIPLEIKHVNVTINRPEFTFNPTSCEKLAVTGSLWSTEGTTSLLSVPFQATNCASLGFKPTFGVSTSGKTSRENGASLNVKLLYPKTPFGSEANIKSVKVELPKQLPSRLTTLQKACTAAQFTANPAGCPAASLIGHATATTPLLPVPLTGPVYFVSHGGEAFPSLIVVLQGYGITLNLVGTTFISKQGITSSTFQTIPDAPVGSFELNLPEGQYSALTANGSLCGQKLTMPTEFKAQNGAQINQTTKIAVTGCSESKKAKSKKKHNKGKGAGKGGRKLRK